MIIKIAMIFILALLFIMSIIIVQIEDRLKFCESFIQKEDEIQEENDEMYEKMKMVTEHYQRMVLEDDGK